MKPNKKIRARLDRLGLKFSHIERGKGAVEEEPLGKDAKRLVDVSSKLQQVNF